MKTEGTNLLLLTISAFWSSSRWPPRWAPEGREVLGGRYRQVSLYKLSGVVSMQWDTHPGNSFNILRPKQYCRHFINCIFKLNENVWISLKISLKFVSRVRTNNIPALVQVMAWRRTGDKPLSEPMMLNYWRIYPSLGHNEQNNAA